MDTPTAERTSEDELAQARRRTFSPARMALQVVGFIGGVLLVAWCVRTAAAGADWSRLAGAGPGRLAALLGLSILSMVLNGWAFHVSCPAVLRADQARPGFMALQGVNAAATLGNFAPLRLGMLERIAYHLRVDRMRAMQIAGWFTLLLASVLAPTAAAGIALVAGVTALGPLLLVMVIGTAAFTLMGQAICIPLQRYRGIGPLAAAVAKGPTLYRATAIRVVDMLGIAARTYIAADILGIALDFKGALVVSTAGAIASLGPLGRVGFREAGMALSAQVIAGTGFEGGLDAASAQLALVDSLGEVAVAATFGAVATIWLVMRVLRAGARSPAQPAHGG